MDPGPEGERAGGAALGGPLAGGDVEAFGTRFVVEVAVAGEGAHDHNRALGEGHVAVDDLLGEDAGGEGSDGLEAQGLLHGRGGELRIGSQGGPLLGVFGEQPDGVRQLALAGVHAAHEDVEDEVDALTLREPVPLLLGGDQLGDQVVPGVLRRAARSARAYS